MYIPLYTIHSHAPSIRVGGGVGVYYSRIPVWVSSVWDRVWVTHFLASAMIIFHASAAGGPPSPYSSIYIRLHPQEPTKIATVVNMSTVRFLLAVAVMHKMNLSSLDVVQAYLHAELDRPLYMRVPPGLVRTDADGNRLVRRFHN